MPLSKIQFRPGVNRETTSYGDENGWFNSDLIRFRKGRPEKMGGWSRLSSNTIEGTGRSLHTWAALDGSKFMGLGTEAKFYIEQGGGYNDITPIRSTATLGSNPLKTGSVVSGATVITVTAIAHGAVTGDYVTFSGATAVDGITTAQLNIEHKVTVVDSNSYQITTTGTASSGNTAGGGSAVIANYQINTGLNTVVTGTGFGAGLWSGVTTGYSQTTLNDSGGINDSVTSFTLTSATNFETAATTTSADLTVASSSITVANSSGFPARGTLIIGTEKIRYGTNVSNVFGDLTRADDGTTAATSSSGDAVTFVGLMLIGSELIQYTGKSTHLINAGVVRGARGTSAASHSDGATVKEANDFVGWGSSSSTAANTGSNIRLYSQDNWGEDLLLNVFDGTPYYWDKTLGLGSRATDLASQPNASGAPLITRRIMVSGADRHVVCFGSNPLNETAQDLLMVRWSDQENPADWTPTATNTAGSQRISSGSEIISAQKTRQEMLIWTDTALHAMRFTGPPFTFGFSMLANNVSIIGPNAVTTVGDKVFWMDRENFYVYTGRVQVIPCTLLRYVFDDINLDQSFKCFAASNKMFDEVFWFYPTADSTEIDRYVKFNFTENTWDLGTLSRTAWVDYGIHNNPRASGISNSTNFVYIHETGDDDDGSAMTSFIESADFDLGDGEQFMFVSRLIPDIDITSTSATASVDYVLKTRNFPGDSLATNSTNVVTSSTQQSFLRSRSRQAALRIESSTTNITWTLGDLRLDIRPDGRR
tara:strand:+ start:1033 stop:3324 length:2292 start_codon:yes stop_codon:yes gene_type:complete